MEIVNRTRMEVAVIGGRVYFPSFSLTIIVKGTFDLCPGEPARLSEDQLLPTGDEPYEDDGEPATTLRYESDFAYFKPKADLMLVGKAHAPGRKPVPHVPVEFRVGAHGKALAVSGDRWWRTDVVRSQPSEPVPFSTMELRYENAFGGERFKANWAGKGYTKIPSEWGYPVWPLPNVEDPAARIESPRDVRFPAGFGPLSREWDGRSSKVGSYNAGWLATRWPWFPDDFDWSYFNAARPDMQVDGYLRGDEAIELTNLDPELPYVRAALPGTRVRCFLNEDTEVPHVEDRRVPGPANPQAADESTRRAVAGPRFREVAMCLDTLWIDAEQQKLVLVWRGVAQVRSEEYDEVAHLLVVSEELSSAPRTMAACRQELEDVLAREAEESEPAELDALFAPEEGFADEEPDPDEEIAAAVAELNEKLATAGHPTVVFPPDPASLPTPSPEVVAQSEALLREYGLEDDEEPEPPTGPLSGEEVEARLKAGETLAGQDLTGADLSGMNLTGADLNGALLVNAVLRGVRLDRTNMTDTNLTEADLSSAFLRQADLTGADLTNAVLSEADLSGTILHDATLEGADLRSARLDRLQAHDAVLAGATLDDASATGATFRGVDFSKSTLTGADLRGADLSEACLEGAVAAGADFSGANLRELQASDGADFSKVCFRDAVAVESIWSESKLVGADFTFCTLEGADFTGADLYRAKLTGADLRFGRLTNASLREAQLIECNLFQSTLENAVLDYADLTGANLYGAEILDARFDGARLDGANLKMTKFGTKLMKSTAAEETHV